MDIKPASSATTTRAFLRLNRTLVVFLGIAQQRIIRSPTQ